MQSLCKLVGAAAVLLAAAQNALALPSGDLFDRASVVEKRTPGQAFSDPELAARADKYLNSKTKPFAVNGSAIPDANFNVGESYAGLLPISQSPNETRKLFFWYFPSTNPKAKNEILAWFQGGPGCSSLSGLLSENGPFTWDAGTLAPVQNAYTWVNLTNVVWIEQPIGVGFTQGTANITNEYQLGDQLAGFWKNFVDTFDLQNRSVYLTGESYGGYYVPYISYAFLKRNDKKYYNLKGMAINDPIIGDDVIQQQVVIAPFAKYWQNLLYLNDTFIQQLDHIQQGCGYADYINKYLTFPPPKGPFPQLPEPGANGNNTCDTIDLVINAATEVNPCFNIYHITETCPHPWSVLGIVNPGDYSPPGEMVYFNRTDVQKAINAPVGTNWAQCTDKNVFAGKGYDQSDGPAQNDVLKTVIEKTNNVLIGQGNLDLLLSTNGTLMALQNVTWNGKQGFQAAPNQKNLYVPYHPEYNGGSLAESGYAGKWGAERGLTFYQVELSGHELPGYAPGAAYRAVEIMLGRVKDFSSTAGFTTIPKGKYNADAANLKTQQKPLEHKWGKMRVPVRGA